MNNIAAIRMVPGAKSYGYSTFKHTSALRFSSSEPPSPPEETPPASSTPEPASPETTAPQPAASNADRSRPLKTISLVGLTLLALGYAALNMPEASVAAGDLTEAKAYQGADPEDIKQIESTKNWATGKAVGSGLLAMLLGGWAGLTVRKSKTNKPETDRPETGSPEKKGE